MHSHIIAIYNIPLSYGKGIWFTRYAFFCWLCIRISVNVVFTYIRNSIINRWTRLIINIEDKINRSVWDSVGSSVHVSVRSSVQNTVWNSVNVSVGGSVRSSVWILDDDSVSGSVRDSVHVSVHDSLNATIKEYEY